MTQGEPAAAAGACGGPNQQAVGFGQRRHQGTVLGRQRGGYRAVRAVGEGGPQIVGALVIGRQVAAENGRSGCRSTSLRPARRRISGTRNRKAQT